MLRPGDGKAADQNRVDEAEDRSSGAYAESEGHDCHGRKPGILPEHPKAVSQIVPEFFDESGRAHVAALLPDLLHSAKSSQGGVAGFFRAHARFNVVLDLPLEMEAQLFVHVAVQTTGAEKGNHGSPHCVE